MKALIYTDEQEIVSGYIDLIPSVQNTIAMMVSFNDYSMYFLSYDFVLSKFIMYVIDA